MSRRLLVGGVLLTAAVIVLAGALAVARLTSNSDLPPSTTAPLEWNEVGRLDADLVGPGVWTGDRFLLITWIGEQRRLLSSTDGFEWADVPVADEIVESDLLSMWSDGDSAVLLWSRSAIFRSDDGGTSFTKMNGLDIDVPAPPNRGIGVAIRQAMTLNGTTYAVTTTQINFPLFLESLDLPGVRPDDIQSSGFGPNGFDLCVGEQDSRECRDLQLSYDELGLDADQVAAVRSSDATTIWASSGEMFTPITTEQQVGQPAAPMFETNGMTAVSTGSFLLRGDASAGWARVDVPGTWAQAFPTPEDQIVAVTPGGAIHRSVDGLDWELIVDTGASLQTTGGPAGLISSGAFDGYDVAGLSTRRPIIGWSPDGSDWAWQDTTNLPIDKNLRDELDELFSPLRFIVGDRSILAVPNVRGDGTRPVLHAEVPPIGE